MRYFTIAHEAVYFLLNQITKNAYLPVLLMAFSFWQIRQTNWIEYWAKSLKFLLRSHCVRKCEKSFSEKHFVLWQVFLGRRLLKFGVSEEVRRWKKGSMRFAAPLVKAVGIFGCWKIIVQSCLMRPNACENLPLKIRFRCLRPQWDAVWSVTE